MLKYSFNMSNKIKTIFRSKNIILENNEKLSYNIINKSNRNFLGSIKLPEGVSLDENYSKQGLQIKVGNEDKLKKRLKKKLGFFSNLVNDRLKIQKKLIVQKVLLVGTGFKVFNSKLNKGKELIFKLGFSHLIKVKIPKNIKFKIIKFNEIKFLSYDKELMGSFLNFVVNIRFPDSYKGRGIVIVGKTKVKLKKGKIKN